MSQAYVPDKVYLVCTNGTTKSQINVTSQSTVKIAGLRLAATIEDRFTGNFFCAKMIVAGAIIGAIAAAVFVAAVVLSGGTIGVGAAMAIGAAGAAGGAATGAIAAMMPSICSMLTSPNDWAVVHPRVKIEGKKALIEDSKIPCTLGGNVIILYSLEAAEDFTDLKVMQTVADVGGIVLCSALVSGGVATILSGGSAFFANVKMINATFGTKAAFMFAGEGAAWFAGGYAASWGVDQVKGKAYELLGLGDYASGRYEERASEITNSGNPVDHYNAGSQVDYVADASGVPGETYKPKISEYEEIEYERRVGLHTNDGTVIEEYESDRVSNRNPTSVQERNPNRTSITDIEHQTDRSGGYYGRETYDAESGRQLDRLNAGERLGLAREMGKNALPSPLEWGIDAWRIMTNMLLEGYIKDLEGSMQKEAAARASIKVIEKEI